MSTSLPPGHPLPSPSIWEMIEAYAEGHPGTYGGMQVDGERLILAWTGDADERLREMNILFPGEDIAVETVSRSRQELLEIREDIVRHLLRKDGPINGVGLGSGNRVNVSFVRRDDAVERELSERFGDAVRVRVIGVIRPAGAPERTGAKE